MSLAWKACCLVFVFLCMSCCAWADGAELAVSPDSLFFRQAGQTFPVAVSAHGGTLGAFTAAVSTTSGGNWLSVTPTSGSGAATLTVSANTTNLATGEYAGAITITATGFAKPAVVEVELELGTTGDDNGHPGGPGEHGPPSMLLVRPPVLQFHVVAGGSAPQSRQLDIFNPGSASFNWTVTSSVATPSGGKWLKVTPTSGTGKGSVQVSVDPTGLATGQYTGQIKVSSPPSQATVAVNLTVNGSQPAKLVIDPRAFNFIVDPNSTKPLAPQTLNVKNTGSGTFTWTATASVSSPPNSKWLSISPLSGSGNGAITVKADPTGLSAGMYAGKITVKSGTDSADANVFLRIVGPDKPIVVVAPKALHFTASGGTASPATRTINVTSHTSGLSYTATATTAKGGNWLTLTGASGTVPGTITVSVNPGTLQPDVYTGNIQVKVTGAAQEVQNVMVALKVLGANDAARLEAEPGAVSFTAVKGGANPAAKTVKLEPEGIASLGWSAAVTTASGGSWLSVTPTSGTTTAAANSSLSISANIGSLNTGTYTGSVVVTPATSGVPSVSIGVTLVIAATAQGKAGDSLMRVDTEAVAPGPLVALFTEPGDHFISDADLPLNVTITLLDSSGAPVEGASVMVSSSNSEPDLTLTDLGGGQYSGVWRALSSGIVTLTGAAQLDTQSAAVFTVSGDVEAAVSQPAIVFQNGVASAASYAPSPTPMAPGSLVSLFGLGIAGPGGAAAAGQSLPASLGGVTVTIGGFNAALITTTPGSMEQINLQVPFELDGVAQADIVVNNNGVFGVPETVTIGTAPALFTLSQDGTGDGAFLHGADFSLVSASRPAAAGEVILLYATGLGSVSPAVGTGVLGPAFTSVNGNVTVTIGGQVAVVKYAGLAPGFAGLYQLNVVVPAGVSGDVPVVVSVDGTPATGRAAVSVQ